MRKTSLEEVLARQQARDPFLHKWTLPTPNLAELLVPFELLLPNPKPHLRWHDDVDMVATIVAACPTCGSSQHYGCWWARIKDVPSWCSHEARRRLVDAGEHAKLLETYRHLRADWEAPKFPKPGINGRELLEYFAVFKRAEVQGSRTPK